MGTNGPEKYAASRFAETLISTYQTVQHHKPQDHKMNFRRCEKNSWTTEGSDFETRQGQEFSLLYVVQTGSGVHPTSYPMDTGGYLYSGIKRPGREADHSPPTSAEIKKTSIYTSIPPYAFME
jgi:hypothetical protein